MKYLNLFFAAMLAMSSTLASPGAHGPNGEHLDGQANATGATTTVPRIETFTEAFELLGHLSGGELSIMIDRYETNEPVLNGVLEVQYKDRLWCKLWMRDARTIHVLVAFMLLGQLPRFWAEFAP